MPNQANKSNGKSGIVKPKKDTTKASTKKQGTGPSKGSEGHSGDTGNSANGGSKTTSGGSGKD